MTATPNDDAGLIKLAEQLVRDTFDAFDNPDDDWAATLLFTGRRRDRATMIVINPPNQDAGCSQIEQILSAAHASEAVYIASCWTVMRKKPAGGFGLVDRPSLQPDRREIITVHHVTRDSDEMLCAYIERFADRPPRLGPFTSEGGGLALSGRYPDAMRRGIDYGISRN